MTDNRALSEAMSSGISRYQAVIDDELQTASSTLQRQTVEECLPFLEHNEDPDADLPDRDKDNLPELFREAHVSFVQEALGQYPGGYVTMDASRPWTLYWSLSSLYVLGEAVESYQARVIKTYRPMQNTSGGIGGGQGHLSHLAGTYAAILTLALVGGEQAYSLIDRRAMWHWLGQLKQPSGGFRVCLDGEEDTRGAYCAFVALTLFNLPQELPADAPARAGGLTRFSDGVGEYLSRCQTYEGGIASSPGGEAHGAYTFCALACLCLLDTPRRSIARYMDVPALIRWLSSRQYAPEGGLAGRTNKVVDGCYSHWIGGCWPLVEAALDGAVEGLSTTSKEHLSLLDSEELARYILSCCQSDLGGLRDKPSKRPDAYHTCYNLMGLSMTRFKQYYSEPLSSTNNGPLEWVRTLRVEHTNEDIGSVDPIFVIPHQAVRLLCRWSAQQSRIL